MLKDIDFVEFWNLVPFVSILQILLMFAGSFIFYQAVKLRIELGNFPCKYQQFFYKNAYVPLCNKIPINYHLVVVNYNRLGDVTRETFYSMIGSWITYEQNANNQQIKETDFLPTILIHFSLIPTSLTCAICIFEKNLSLLSFGMLDISPKDSDFVMISFKYFAVAMLSSFLSGGFRTYFETIYVQNNNSSNL
jgi:hypothetical protein